MHPNDSQLMAYRDGELKPEAARGVEAHLGGCAACRGRLSLLMGRGQRVADRLQQLGSIPVSRPFPISAARARLQDRFHRKESLPMFQKIFSRSTRPAWAVMVVAAALVAAFLFPPVRALANNFLGLFRVQKVAVLSLDPQQLEASSLSRVGQSLFNLLSEQAETREIGTSQENVSLEEASRLSGMTLRVLDDPAMGQPVFVVHAGLEAKLTLDLPHIRAILDEAQIDAALPDALDRAEIRAEMPIAVSSLYGRCAYPAVPEDPDQQNLSAAEAKKPCVVLMQVASPSVQAPAGIDMAALGQTFLQFVGMSAEDAAAFSQNVDWTTTLVIPVPTSAASEPFFVDGVEGVLLREYPSGVSDFTLIWVKDGMVYALTGFGDRQTIAAWVELLK
jgi:hypothetical protein